jgi:hypothetical protein
VKSLERDLWLGRKCIGFPDDDGDCEDINLPSSGTKGLNWNWIFKVLIQMLKLDSLRDNVLSMNDSGFVSTTTYIGNNVQNDQFIIPMIFMKHHILILVDHLIWESIM